MPATRAVPASQGATATDHFYPDARGCTTDEYRCATIPRLLSDERLANLDFLVATHAQQAADRGLAYRLGETNTAAGRGVAGVSDVAASATWALAAMFHVACPQPPDRPGANRDCHLGAIGVNFHNAERNAFFRPDEGNAPYNAIAFDPSPQAGPPTAQPEYYGLLFFARLVQGQDGLRPEDSGVPGVDGWAVDGRAFRINRTAQPQTTTVAVPGPPGRAKTAVLHRMTPVDPTGAGRTLDAPAVQVDGRSVAADGSFPGLAGTRVPAPAGRVQVTLAPGEAVSVEPARGSG